MIDSRIEHLTNQTSQTDKIDMTKKRLIYIALGTLLTVTACSQEDAIRGLSEGDSNRIIFRASLPQLSTRATEINKDNLDSFQVTCFINGTATPYFSDKKFEKDNDRFLSPDPACVWPNNNAQLNFIAFTPSCGDMRNLDSFHDTDFVLTTGEQESYKLENFNIARDIADQIDFVTANATGNLLDNEESGIKLDFKHQLSRIEIKAYGANKSYDIEIAGIRIGGIAVKGDFNFISASGAIGADATSSWEALSRGIAEYVFRKDDHIITLDETEASPTSLDKAISLMGSKGYANSAMLIPANNGKWDYEKNPGNQPNAQNSITEGAYLSVLLRVIDATNSALKSQVYPYHDNTDNMEVVYLAVGSEGNVTDQLNLYKGGDGKYYTDSANTIEYNPATGMEVKEFGWAALPISGDWQPGLVYTYTLNYSDGVGLREPTDPTEPGKSIISDKVSVTVGVTDWQPGSSSTETVPRK